MYLKFLDGKEKIEANGLICGQKYGSHFTTFLALGIVRPLFAVQVNYALDQRVQDNKFVKSGL